MRSPNTNTGSPEKESSCLSQETEGLSPVEPGTNSPTDSSANLSTFQKFQYRTRNTARKVNNRLQQQNAFDWIEKPKARRGGLILAAHFEDSSYSHTEHDRLLTIKLGGIISLLPPSELGNATFRDEVLKQNELTEKINTRLLPIVDNRPFKKNDFSDIKEAQEFSRKLRDEGKNVLVHCRVGVGRSATFVLIDLMQRKKLKAKNALAKLKRKRIQAEPNLSQMLGACEYVFWDEMRSSGGRLVQTFKDFYRTAYKKYAENDFAHNQKSLESFPIHLQSIMDGAEFILNSDQSKEFEKELPSFYDYLFKIAGLHPDHSHSFTAREWKLELEQKKSEKNQPTSSSENRNTENPSNPSDITEILKSFNQIYKTLREQFEHLLNVGELRDFINLSMHLQNLLNAANNILKKYILDSEQAKKLHANLLETSIMIGSLLYLHSKMMENKYPNEISKLKEMNNFLKTTIQKIKAMKDTEADAVLEKLIEATKESIKKFNEYTKHNFLHASENLNTVNAWKDTFTTKLAELEALKAKKIDPDFNLNLGQIETIQKEMLTAVSLDSDITLILKDEPSEQELKAKYDSDKKPILIKNSQGEISIYGISEKGKLEISPLDSKPFEGLVFNREYSELKSFEINKQMRKEIQKAHDPKYSRNPFIRLLLEIQKFLKCVFDIGRSKRNQSLICISNLQRALSSSVTKNCENINAFFKIPPIPQPAAEPANQMPAPEV